MVCALVGKSDLTAWGAYANSGPHNTCLPRPEAPRHVSSGRCMYPATYADTCITRAQRRVRTRHTHLDPGDVHPTPIAQTTGMILGQHILETCVYCPGSCCSHARTHAPTGTPWFTNTGTHTLTTSGTRTLMSQERVDQVDSHGRWKGPCLQTNPQCDPVSQHQLHHVDESTLTAPHCL